MWWSKTVTKEEDRKEDYGPEYGVDYARFSDPPDILKDLQIKEALSQKFISFDRGVIELHYKVRNGFVLLQGLISSYEVREALIEVVRSTEGVKEVINNLNVRDEQSH